MTALLDLSDNANLWGPPPGLDAALKKVRAEDVARYPDAHGQRLKGLLARWLDVDPRSVIVGCGSDDLLEASLRILLGPGKSLAHAEPTFSMIGPFASGAGVELRPVTLGPDGTLSLERVLAAASHGLYLCSPNNPTGTVLSPEWITEAVARSEALVMLDEAYIEFADRPTSAARAAASERLMVFRTFSKAWGLAGLRLGYAIGPPHCITRLEAVRGPYTANAVATAVLPAVLEDEPWVRQRADEARSARTTLALALEARGLRPLVGQANFLFVPAANAMAIGAALLSRSVRVRVLEKLPGFGDALRIAVGPPEAMSRLLIALDGAMAEVCR